MNLKRIGILLGKELWHGPRGFVFVWAVIMPLLLSFGLSALFGTLFSEAPKLGIYDEGSSQLVGLAGESASIRSRTYDSLADLRQATEVGTVDMGIVLPSRFDSAVAEGEEVEISAFTWGESLAQDRTVLKAAVTDLVREMNGADSPSGVTIVTVGDDEIIPWSERLLPLIMLLAVFLGGLFLPATSIITEKANRTLTALIITPASIADIFVAKGLLGIILSLIVGIVVLVINQAFGSQPLLLALILTLGAVMAAELGLICGAVFKDISTLFAVWKSAGIFLFGPAVIYMFPAIPAWIGRLFPSYYLLEPLMAVTQRGSGWTEIALNVFILIGIDVILFGLVMLTIRRSKQLSAA